MPGSWNVSFQGWGRLQLSGRKRRQPGLRLGRRGRIALLDRVIRCQRREGGARGEEGLPPLRARSREGWVWHSTTREITFGRGCQGQARDRTPLPPALRIGGDGWRQETMRWACSMVTGGSAAVSTQVATAWKEGGGSGRGRAGADGAWMHTTQRIRVKTNHRVEVIFYCT